MRPGCSPSPRPPLNSSSTPTSPSHPIGIRYYENSLDLNYKALGLRVEEKGRRVARGGERAGGVGPVLLLDEGPMRRL